MNAEQEIRERLGPADPGQWMDLPSAPLTAADLVARAETIARLEARQKQPVWKTRGARWWVAAATTAVLAAGSAMIFYPSVETAPEAPQRVDAFGDGAGQVLTPIAYQIPADPPAAGPLLDDLAKGIRNASYDGHIDTYAFRHRRSWGSVRAMAPGGLFMSLVQESEVWSDRNGMGESRIQELRPEFPDAESQRYWQKILEENGVGQSLGSPVTSTGLVGPHQPLRDDRAAVETMLKVGLGAPAVAKSVNDVYTIHVVPRTVRARILSILADVPGFHWRGAVVDRAGRPGVAITADDKEHGVQLVLVFNEKTGELLAHENVRLAESREVIAYNLFLNQGYKRAIN